MGRFAAQLGKVGRLTCGGARLVNWNSRLISGASRSQLKSPISSASAGIGGILPLMSTGLAKTQQAVGQLMHLADGAVNELVEVLKRPQIGVHAPVVGDVEAPVGVRRGEGRVQP